MSPNDETTGDAVLLKIHRQFGRDEAFRAALEAISNLQAKMRDLAAKLNDKETKIRYLEIGTKQLKEQLEKAEINRKAAVKRERAEWKEKVTKLRTEINALNYGNEEDY